MQTDALTPAQRDMARHWFGYGHWDAPYWFVGIEPGGYELDACVRQWNALGRAELVDIAAHHEEHDMDWFSDNCTRPQPTWQKLIWLILRYKGLLESPATVLHYQRRQLGRASEETALIEISCLPASSRGKEMPRMLFREKRCATIRDRMIQHRPHYVVFYSPDNGAGRRYVSAWNSIAGTELVRDIPVLVGSTACVMTYHPNGNRSKLYWQGIADRLRAARSGAR